MSTNVPGVHFDRYNDRNGILLRQALGALVDKGWAVGQNPYGGTQYMWETATGQPNGTGPIPGGWAYRRAFITTNSCEDALDIVQDAMVRLAKRYADRVPCSGGRCCFIALCRA